MSSLSASGAFADWGGIWFEAVGARDGGGANVGVFAEAGAEREFGILALEGDEPAGIIDGGAMFASVGSGRIGTVRTFFGSPIDIDDGPADALGEFAGRLGATAAAH